MIGLGDKGRSEGAEGVTSSRGQSTPLAFGRFRLVRAVDEPRGHVVALCAAVPPCSVALQAGSGGGRIPLTEDP